MTTPEAASRMLKADPAATVAGAMTALAKELREAGIESAELDARLLTSAAARMTREAILREPDMPLSRAAAWLLAGFKARRLANEPVSRILGGRDFYGRRFRVTLAVLDPRPETETLVDAALEVITAEGWRERPLRILDVGTGTGCILLTLLAELPRALGLGSDVSQEAVVLALDNAEALGLSSRASFDVRRSLEPRLDGSNEVFDVVVSNPPYIPTRDIDGLAPEVRHFDPLGALDGGGDGLDIYRELASGLLVAVPDGWALFEVGAGQSAAVAGVLQSGIPPARLRELRVWADLGGHNRCVAVRTQL